MKLKTKTFLMALAALFIITNHSKLEAQFSNKTYQMESIFLQNGKYVKNGIAYPIGFLAKNLKKEMEVSPMAVIEFQNYEKKRNTALIFSSIGLASLVSALFVENTNVQTGLIVAGVGATIVSFPFTIKASNSFEKAIWIRNGDILN